MLIVLAGDKKEGWRQYMRDTYPDNHYMTAEALPAMTIMAKRRLAAQKPLVLLVIDDPSQIDFEETYKSVRVMMAQNFPLIVVNTKNQQLPPDIVAYTPHIYDDFYAATNVLSNIYSPIKEPIAVVVGEPLL